LKASSRNHEDDLEILSEVPKVSSQIRTTLKSKSPEEFKRRPKMLEAISVLSSKFESETGRSPAHLFDLVKFSLDSLEQDGHFDSDLFAKSQHGGDREVHVIECRVRVVQYFLELIAKIYCKRTAGETITNPQIKETFVKNHYKDANLMLMNL
jgi:hypothetical protein